jgi:hypothetical protein
MRRLSRTEYDNTIRDLLQDGSRPATTGFAADQEAGDSGFVQGGTVSTVDAQRLMETAQQLAATAVKKLGVLVPCSPLPTAAADQDRCARDFIVRFGKRAYRRPLTTAEVGYLASFYADARAGLGYGFADGIRMLLQVMLQSPNFLYRRELGPANPLRDGTLVRFNDYELASRLSYFLWASMPDDALLAAADAGQLRAAADVEAQARRLLADPRAKDMLADFQRQWLELGDLVGLQKDPAVYPTFSADVAASMASEAREFIAFVLGSRGDGKLDTLLGAPFSFLDGNLAKIYKQAGVTGTGVRQVMLDGAQRAGLLTQTGFLTVHAAPGGSHPVKRGRAVLERLLCTELPVPPANIPTPRPPAPNLSTRERFAEHGRNECAIGCHALTDPLGFAFEGYDGVGAFRTTDGGKPVDASGAVTLSGQKHPFADGVELSRLLARSTEVRSCVATQWLRYALKRREVRGDEASLALATDRFARAGYDVRELLVAAASTRSFLYRQPSAGEVLP